MNIVRAGTLGLALFGLSACGDFLGLDLLGPQDSPLVIEILDTQTEPPAKVTVTFQVSTEAGAPVPNLSVDAFEILDNGQSDSGFESSKAFQPKPGRFQTSVALLLDMSGSITGSPAFPLLKTAAAAFVDNSLDASGVVVGVWWFDGGSDLVQLVDFTDDSTALKAAIDGLTEDVTRDNSTNLNGAVQLGIGVVEQQLQNGASGVSQAGALVIFTDGTDQASRVPAAAALSAVAATDISIYSIGLRGEIDETFLSRIGRSGSAFADNSDALLGQFSTVGDQIEAMANSFYVLAYCSPRRAGASNQLTIRVRFGERLAQATTSYPAVNFTGGCTL
ncbi:MAG: VWA domain-containing protein [Gemmatimonadota bacterium]|nr:VWA domain-containing protein [Gemmatimonadota bacterium]MDH3422255.1 VWA domain-containing protein [Gemmatimonadota bacterium]